MYCSLQTDGLLLKQQQNFILKGGNSMFSEEQRIEAALATMTAGDVVDNRQLKSEVRNYFKGVIRQYFDGEFNLPVTAMINGRSRFEDVPGEIKKTVKGITIWSARKNGKL